MNIRQKGKRYEREIAALYRHYGLDDTATPMPMSGGMEFHKGDILKKKDSEWIDECKNQETTKLWEWWEQASRQAPGLHKPALHIKRNHSESLTVIRTEDFFQLRVELQQLRDEAGI